MLINFLVCFVICIIFIYIFTNINYKTYILKTKPNKIKKQKKKIQCTRCEKAPIIKLKDAVFLKAETTQYCTSCQTELAYVIGNDFIPKYNSWFIRANTAMIINN